MSAYNESDPDEELKRYLSDNQENDPFQNMKDWLGDGPMKKKKTKKKKINKAKKFISVKRDEFGNKIYQYSGKKRYVKKKNPGSARHNAPSPSDLVWDDWNPSEIDIEDDNEEEKKRITWNKRMEHLEQAWADEKENVLESLKSSIALQDCDLCQTHAVLSCHECCLELCHKCDIEIHKNKPLHNRTLFLDGLATPIPPNEVLNENDQIYVVDRLVPLKHPKCVCGSVQFHESTNQRKVVVITMKGKFELLQSILRCCKCERITDPFTLSNILSSGFWPSSPTHFGCLIDVDVFLTWDQFKKHMPGSSSTAFLDSLNDLTLYFGRQGRIVPSSFYQGFKQWNFIRYELDMKKGMDWMKCPCCSIKQHACHIDGNAKLYRYQRSGMRRRKSYYNEAFIADDKKVETFVSSLRQDMGKTIKTSSDTSCGGEWSAARNTERKRKSVDDTGLYVASCRHQYGLKSINMKRGEIYAYPAYLLTNFILPNKVEYLFADVMCKLWPYLCKVDSNLPSKIKGALSVMHAKGHNLRCQVSWDGEWIQGSGKSTGEECEQLFSFLSRCANTTKYQSPENREETLTEMILFWNRRKTLVLAESLLKKFKRITKEVSIFEDKLDKKCVEMGITIKDVDFVSLLNKLKIYASGGSLSPCKPTSHQQMILLYHDLNKTPSDASEISKDLLQKIVLPDLNDVHIPLLAKNKAEKELLLNNVWDNDISATKIQGELDLLRSAVLVPAFQNAIQSCRFEMLHWNIRLKKYADSAKLRCACRLKFSEVNKKLNSLLERFITVKSLEDVSEFELIKESNHRLLLEFNAKKDRCLEELELLKRDMESYLTFYTSKITTELKIDHLASSDSERDNAADTVLKRIGIKFARSQLKKGFVHFATVLPKETIQKFQNVSGIDQDDCQNVEATEVEYNGEDNQHLEKEENEDMEEAFDIDINAVQLLGKNLGGQLDPQEAVSGRNFVFLPSCFSQNKLNGRNGSNACCVIALLTGYFMSQLPKICFRDSVPLFVGCIDVGNSLHEEGRNLLVQEAISLLPFRINVFEERDSLPKNVQEVLSELISKSAIVIATCNLKSVCIVRSSGNEKIYIFDSHRHNDMGPLIAWVEDDIGDIIEYIPFAKDDDQIYFCSVQY